MKIAAICDIYAYTYCEHIFARLPQEHFEILIPDDKIANFIANCDRQLRCPIRRLALSLSDYYDVLLIDEYYKKDVPLPGYKELCLIMHSSDGAIFPEYRLQEGYHLPTKYIFQHRNACFSFEKEVQINGRILECAYTGLYQLGKLSEWRKSDRNELRQRFAEQNKLEIPNDRPVVVCYSPEWGYPGEIVAGLKLLSTSCFIIFKHFSEPVYREIEGYPSILSYHPQRFSDNLLRFCGDVILCESRSGVFTTSVMLGLHVIPVFTHNVLDMKKEKYIKAVESESYHTKNTSNRKLLDLIGGGIHITASSEIYKKIMNIDYWKWYDSNISSWQRQVFGDYLFDRADEKTALLIMHLALHGTFGKYKHAN